MNPIAVCAVSVLALCGLAVPVAAGAQGAFPDSISFSLERGEIPEGLAIDRKGNVYVSIRQSPMGPIDALSDQVWRFSPTGEKTVLADLGSPGGGGCGLALDEDGNVYMARTLPPPHNGVYRVDDDGRVSRVRGTDQIAMPDALAFGRRGTLYVTETFSGGPPNWGQGGIWRVPKGGKAELWLRHELLTGLQPTLFPFPVGANGIAFHKGSLYVVNTDKCIVVRIEVQPDGSPGTPEVWAQVEDVPESMFYLSPYFPLMIDGLTFDALDNLYVTVTSRNAIVRFDANGQNQQTLAVLPGVALDAPVNPLFGTVPGERTNLFVTNMGICRLIVGEIPGVTWPGPGLVKIPVGIPGSSPLP